MSNIYALLQKYLFSVQQRAPGIHAKDNSYQVQGQMGCGKAEWHDSYFNFFSHVESSAVPCSKRYEAMLRCREDQYCQNWVIDNT